MLYQLPNGTTIEISTSDYFALSDEELLSLQAFPNIAQGIQDPMHGSALRGPQKYDDIDPTYSEYDIQDVPLEERRKDQDYEGDDVEYI